MFPFGLRSLEMNRLSKPSLRIQRNFSRGQKHNPRKPDQKMLGNTLAALAYYLVLEEPAKKWAGLGFFCMILEFRYQKVRMT